MSFIQACKKCVDKCEKKKLSKQQFTVHILNLRFKHLKCLKFSDASPLQWKNSCAFCKWNACIQHLSKNFFDG